jgi:hypothetical protein
MASQTKKGPTAAERQRKYCASRTAEELALGDEILRSQRLEWLASKSGPEFLESACVGALRSGCCPGLTDHRRIRAEERVLPRGGSVKFWSNPHRDRPGSPPWLTT